MNDGPGSRSDAPRLLLLVVGAARSGTSTVAGLLDGLGLHVPGPFLKENPSNPKGFFESRWSVKFHNALLSKAGVRINDNRLDAPDRLRAACGPRRQARMRAWLSEASGDRTQTVLKDPRATYSLALWAEAASDVGLAARTVLMLRHPAEVVGSRQTYYADTVAARALTSHDTASLAGWLAGTLIAERDSREHGRVMVRYPDLLADWRSELAQVAQVLGLTYDPAPEAGRPHPLDGFVDPALNRHDAGWDQVDAPDDLVRLADEVWDACGRLTMGGDQQGQRDELDRLRARYQVLQNQAAVLARGVAPTVASPDTPETETGSA